MNFLLTDFINKSKSNKKRQFIYQKESLNIKNSLKLKWDIMKSFIKKITKTVNPIYLQTKKEL
jgi:hypothetical protein